MSNINFFERFLVIEWWDVLWKAPVIAAFAKRFHTTSFSKSFTDKYH